jgi:ABC-type lipoprotein release transport system permease subunit
MRSLQEGTWDYMIDGIVHIQTGYLQVHKTGYWEDRSIDKAFHPDSVNKYIHNVSSTSFNGLMPRTEQYALAAAGNKSRGILVIGIDPILENEFGELSDKIIEGGYLDHNENGVMVAKGLADILGLNVGDSLILLGQGYRGVSAAGLYPITGILEFGNPELNKLLVYMTIGEAGVLFGTDDLLTTQIVRINNPRQVRSIQYNLKEILPAKYEVIDYKTMLPDLMQAKELDRVGAWMIAAILYLIIFFGLFGTILMMLKEREYEFGVLQAIGMSTWKMFQMVWLELLFLGFIGVILGSLVSVPIVYYLNVDPIKLKGELADAYAQFGVEPVLPTAFYPSIFFSQILVVGVIVMILSIYPFYKIKRLVVTEALRG